MFPVADLASAIASPAIQSLVNPGAFHVNMIFSVSIILLFVVSLVSNATPFFGAAYTLIATSELIAFGFTPQIFLLVTLVTALGAALGKLIIYAGAKGFQRSLRGNKNVKLLGGWLRNRNFLVVVFVTAVIPALPLDDYLFIGAGATDTKLLPMFSVTILAKIVKSAIEISLEFFGILRITNFIPHLLHITPFEFSILLSVIFVILGIVFFKYDWEKLLNRVTKPHQD